MVLEVVILSGGHPFHPYRGLLFLRPFFTLNIGMDVLLQTTVHEILVGLIVYIALQS